MNQPNFNDPQFLQILMSNGINLQVVQNIMMMNVQMMMSNPMYMSIYNQILQLWQHYISMKGGMGPVFNPNPPQTQNPGINANGPGIIYGEGEDQFHMPSHVIAVTFNQSTGGKKVINASSRATVQKLMETYAERIGVSYENFKKNIVCIFNSTKIEYDSKDEIGKLFKTDNCSIVVYDQKNIIGA